MKDEKNNSGNLNFWILMVIILYGLALYYIPLHSTFFCPDDRSSVEYNKTIKQIDIPKIFNAFNSRSLVGLSFALNYRWGALNPAGYRLINLLIHCLNAFLVYLLIKSTLYLYSARKPTPFGRLEWPAFFASMLFLCHPIQTEPVNYITQRFVLMGSFFYLLTLYLYIQYRCRSQKRYMIMSMGSAIAAMFCKEFVATLPLMLVLYEFYFINFLNETIGQRFRHLIPFFVIVLIIPILLLRMPSEVIDVANIAVSDSIQTRNTPKGIKHIDITRDHSSFSRKQYFLTELNVVCTYVRLLFLPVNQNFSYDYPISGTMDNKTTLCGIFLLCLLALAAVTCKSYRIVSFSILWFFIALSVDSSFIPIGHVIAEYRLYLASVGFVFLVMTFIYMTQQDRKKLYMMGVAILIGFSILTYQRNKVWKNRITFWSDTIRKSPYKAELYRFRGDAYYRQGDFAQAIADLTKAIEITPDDARAYNIRGTYYIHQGNFTQAMLDFKKSIEILPNYAESYITRGNVYLNQGNFVQAIVDFSKAIEINPNDAPAYAGRGFAYNQQNDFSKAITDFNKAIELNPNIDPYTGRGFAYMGQKNLSQAISDFNRAIEINPDDAPAYAGRGFAYNQQNDFSKAIADFNKAIEINPNDVQFYQGRARAYFLNQEYDNAWFDVHKVESLGGEIDPGFLDALKKA